LILDLRGVNLDQEKLPAAAGQEISNIVDRGLGGKEAMAEVEKNKRREERKWRPWVGNIYVGRVYRFVWNWPDGEKADERPEREAGREHRLRTPARKKKKTNNNCEKARRNSFLLSYHGLYVSATLYL